MAGAFAGFALIIALFSKLFPLISIWEVEEHYEEETVRVPRREALAFQSAFGQPNSGHQQRAGSRTPQPEHSSATGGGDAS